jgi:hypothetical protein
VRGLTALLLLELLLVLTARTTAGPLLVLPVYAITAARHRVTHGR